MTAFSDILSRYGEEGTVICGGISQEVKLFVQPVFSSSSSSIQRTMSELGQVDTDRYYCFGPHNSPVPQKDDIVICGDVRYQVIRAEAFKVGGDISHWEAMLLKERENYNA